MHIFQRFRGVGGAKLKVFVFYAKVEDFFM